MTIGIKIAIACVLGFILVAVVAVLSITSLSLAASTYAKFIDVDQELMLGATRLQTSILQQSAGFRGYLLFMNPESLQLHNQGVLAFSSELGRMKTTVTDPADRNALEEMEALQSRWELQNQRMMEIRRSGRPIDAAVQQYNEQVSPIREELFEKIQAFLAHERTVLATARQDLLTQLRNSLYRLLLVSLSIIVLGGLTAILMVRSISGRLRSAVSLLSSSTAEITAMASQMASGASQTAVSVNETITTVEEVKQTAELSATKARHVSDIAQKTLETAHRRKASALETIEGMKRMQEQMDSVVQSIMQLNEQSRAIGEIIATVNELSEQSNILAVNAAIEAARAGEQGKGFGIVAQEIKSLADQSKQATIQVRAILNDVQKATSAAVMATERGSKIVDNAVQRAIQAGESMRELSVSSEEAAQAAVQIAASSQQQLVGMDQIASAMESIQEATTQSVAGTRQTEQAAQSLSRLGHELRAMIERNGSYTQVP